RLSPCADGAQARHQRMADARTGGEALDLRARIPRADEDQWRTLLSVCDLEGHVLCGVHPARCRCVRVVLRALRADGSSGSNHCPDRTQAGLLLPVALRGALSPSAVARNAG